MKIGIISPAYLPIPPKKYGGTERVIYYLIKGLRELGHTLILFGPADSEVDCEIIPIIDKATGFSQNSEEDKMLSIKRNEALKKAYTEVEKNKHRFDILHSHGIDIKQFSQIPHLFTLHLELVLSDPANRSRELKYFKERENLFYNTISYNALETFQNLNVVSTVYNGLDPQEFPFVETPQNYYCFIGRFNPDKNPHQAIELAIEKKKKIKIAAKYEYVDDRYYKEKCLPLLNNEFVEDTTEQNNLGKIEIISNAEVNLHPTNFREPFGLTVMESAYCGTPTLAVRKGSMSELIEDGKSGVLVEDFTQGYFEVDKCRDLDRKYIAERSRRKFNYKVMAKQYELTYQNITKIYKDNINNNKHKLPKYLEESRAGVSSLYNNITRNNLFFNL